MSKVIKGIKKHFKRVIKVLKKVVPIVLAAAAIYFTAGAALGFTGAAGFGGAVSSITAGLGTGALGGAVTGAITAAGYGAAIGGVTSELSGGSFTEGAQRGAAIGAVTGGISGGIGGARSAATAASSAGTAPATAPAAVPPAGPGLDQVRNMIPLEQTLNTGSGLLRSGADWVTKNQQLVGSVVSGLGQGLLAGSEADAYLEIQRRRAANYEGTDPGRNFRDLAGSGSGGAPTNRYDPRSYGSYEYQYDPTQGRIIRVPVAQ